MSHDLLLPLHRSPRADDIIFEFKTKKEKAMSSYTKCPDKETCQKVIAEMERRGIQYVPNHAHLPHDGTNYVKQHGFLFSTCSESEFELNQLNNEEQ